MKNYSDRESAIHDLPAEISLLVSAVDNGIDNLAKSQATGQFPNIPVIAIGILSRDLLAQDANLIATNLGTRLTINDKQKLALLFLRAAKSLLAAAKEETTLDGSPLKICLREDPKTRKKKYGQAMASMDGAIVEKVLSKIYANENAQPRILKYARASVKMAGLAARLNSLPQDTDFKKTPNQTDMINTWLEANTLLAVHDGLAAFNDIVQTATLAPHKSHLEDTAVGLFRESFIACFQGRVQDAEWYLTSPALPQKGRIALAIKNIKADWAEIAMQLEERQKPKETPTEQPSPAETTVVSLAGHLRSLGI